MKPPILALGVAVLLLTGAVHAQNAPTKVNGVTIPQARVDFFVKNAAAQGQADSPELRSRVRDTLITREVLAQEAVRKGLDKNADVAMQIQLQRQEVLINAVLQDYAKAHPVNDETLKKEYEQIRASSGDREFKARHILVEKEDEAKEITAQLRKGANFEKIAAEKSQDTGSKVNGGALDWSPANRYVAPFAQALTKLKKGQTTETPVQSQFGWHIIRLDDERPLKFPPFDQVKPQLQQQMQQQSVKQLIGDLRAKAKIE